jgi:peptidoglycan/xylan/chitin deacetylase (PgdA/CDA1 family)
MRVFFMALLPLACLTAAHAQVITSGPPACPGVALTFDLCPVRGGSGYDDRLIRYLIDHRIPATFFMSGKWMTKHDEQVKTLLEIPFFEVGTHGEVHAHLPMHSLDEQTFEIQGPVNRLKTKYAHETSLFRPPYGEYNEETVEAVRSLGLRFILWNVVSGDPDPTLSAEQIEHRLTKLTRSGSIIVLHANGKGRYTYEAVVHLNEHVLPQRHLKPMTVTDVLSC